MLVSVTDAALSAQSRSWTSPRRSPTGLPRRHDDIDRLTRFEQPVLLLEPDSAKRVPHFAVRVGQPEIDGARAKRFVQMRQELGAGQIDLGNRPRGRTLRALRHLDPSRGCPTPVCEPYQHGSRRDRFSPIRGHATTERASSRAAHSNSTSDAPQRIPSTIAWRLAARFARKPRPAPARDSEAPISGRNSGPAESWLSD